MCWHWHPVWAHQDAHFEEQRNKNNFLSARLSSQNASTSANACQSCLKVSTAVYQPVRLTFTFSPPMPDRAQHGGVIGRLIFMCPFKPLTSRQHESNGSKVMLFPREIQEGVLHSSDLASEQTHKIRSLINSCTKLKPFKRCCVVVAFLLFSLHIPLGTQSSELNVDDQM